jgi:hypothetical protein
MGVLSSAMLQEGDVDSGPDVGKREAGEMHPQFHVFPGRITLVIFRYSPHMWGVRTIRAEKP